MDNWDVDLSLVAADAAIAGHLMDQAGNPVTDAEGWVSATHLVTPTLHNGAPIEAGTFDIYVPRGVYGVAAHLPACAVICRRARARLPWSPGRYL